MFLRRRKSPAIIVIAFVGFCVALRSGSANAKRGKRARSSDAVGLCVDNYKTGLEREKAGQLVEARETYIRCAKSVCGSPLREECTARFTHLSTDIPSVVPVVTDAAGRPDTDIEVRVDGAALASSLHGQSFLLDPGVREFSFSKGGHIFATQTLMIVQGQRDRLIAATLEPPVTADGKHSQGKKIAASPGPARVAVTQARDVDSGDKGADTPATDVVRRKVGATTTAAIDDPAPALTLTAEDHSTTRRIPMLSYVFAGTGLAALGAGALLTIWGRSDTNKLSVCSPSCPQSSADHIHTLYLASDISIGVGIAALVASYWSYAHSRSSQESQGEEAALRARPTMVGIQPTSSGALGTVSGSF